MKTTENERLDQLLSALKSRTPQPDIDAWLTEDESEAYDRIVGMRVRRRRIVRWAAAAVFVGIVVTIGLQVSGDEGGTSVTQPPTAVSLVAEPPVSSPSLSGSAGGGSARAGGGSLGSIRGESLGEHSLVPVSSPSLQGRAGGGSSARAGGGSSVEYVGGISDLYTSIDEMTDQALREAERLTMETLSRVVASDSPS